jgi:hypothetical protein
VNIEDYKKLFEIKHEGGWSDDDVWYARCKICGILPIFDKYMIRNWYNLNGYQRKKRFYASIRHHVNTYHHELIPSRRIKILEQYLISDEALQFLQNFPFRPIKEEKLHIHRLNNIHKVPLTFWKPGPINLPHEDKENE